MTKIGRFELSACLADATAKTMPHAYEVDGIPLAIMAVPKGGARGKPLVVTFHGAISRVRYVIPVFQGAFLLPYLGGGATLLSIADPTLSLSETLGAAWYQGSAGDDVPGRLREIFSTLCADLNPSRTVFTGSSVGAHAALYHSALLPGSICVVKNAIAKVSNYTEGHIRRLRTICWPGLAADDPLSKVILDDVARVYAKGHKNTLIYLQNSTDHHFFRQAVTFLSRIKSNDFLFCSEFFPSNRGHEYPIGQYSNWVQAAVQAPEKSAVAIAETAYALNCGSLAAVEKTAAVLPEEDLAIARSVVAFYAG